MAAIRLTQRRVDTLRPRKTVWNVRDAIVFLVPSTR